MLALSVFSFLFFLGGAEYLVTPISLSNLVRGYVTSESWTYYSFNTRAWQGFSLVVQHSAAHDLDVFISKGTTLPSRLNYDYSEMGLSPNVTIEGRAEADPTHYIVGINAFYGANVPFSLTVTNSGGCPLSCSGHGICERGRCICKDGFVGDGCDSYVTAVEFRKNNGPYTLEKGQWKYFSLGLYTTQDLRVFVEKTSATGDVDFYVRRGQIPTLFEYDYADLTRLGPGEGSFTMNISNPSLGFWYIGAFSFDKVTFDWTVTGSQSCPNSCSRHGECVGVYCHCSPDYFGVSCENARYPMMMGRQYPGFAAANSWNYFRVIADTLNPILVTVETQNDGSDCDLYVRIGANPTRTSFSAKNISHWNDNQISLLVPNPRSTPVHIGVFGFSYCSFKVKAIHVADRCDCGPQGTCRNGVCVCNKGWTGSKCETGTIIAQTDVTYESTVQPGKWTFFTFKTESSRQLVVVMKELETVGNAWIFLANDTYPTLDQYDAVDRDSSSEYHRVEFEFRVLSTGTSTIGIYGNPNTPLDVIPFKLTGYQIEPISS